MRTGDEVTVLRSKYHDWCSARVADRFAELSPEEIYEMAHEGGRDVERDVDASASGDAGAFSLEEAGYSELVRRVTEALAGALELPTFEAWVESYRREPERYEQEMVGFWKVE